MSRPAERVVIVGGGIAGLRGAEALRAGGFDGSITVLAAEPWLPYDRPPLSKAVLTGERRAEDTVLRQAATYEKLAVDVLVGTPADGVDLAGRAVVAGDRRLPFDGLLIATGCRPRTLPGAAGLDGVHVLRTLDDARELAAAFAGGPRVVVVGAGFIGGEAAASARALGLEVTIVEQLDTPLARAIGPAMGEAYAALHRAHGTRLVCGATVAAFEGAGRLERVRLGDGSAIEADVAVVAIGVEPDTAWLEGSGLRVADGIVCDATLNAGHPQVYAAGDVVRWHNALFAAQMRVEHWTNAAEQGRRAAQNLLAGSRAAEPYAGSNYFWSDQYGARVQFVGTPRADEVRIVAGAPGDEELLAYYRGGDRLVGALAFNRPRLLMQAKLMVERRAGWDEALDLLAAA